MRLLGIIGSSYSARYSSLVIIIWLAVVTSSSIAFLIISSVLVPASVIIVATSISWLVALLLHLVVILPLLVVWWCWLIGVMAHNFSSLGLSLQNGFFSSLLHYYALFIISGFGLLNEALNCFFVLLHEWRKLVGQINDKVGVEIPSFEVFAVTEDVATT